MLDFGSAQLNAANDAPLAGLSVLLLEDEFLIALDAESLLAAMGAARVEVVNTLDAAAAALDGEPFDLAVFDINVNGEMSFPVAERYAARDVLVVFASGYELREPPILAGKPAACVSKPYTPERLKRTLTTALASRGA